MKKLTSLMLCAMLIFSLTSFASAADAPSNSAGAAILIDADSGQTLFRQSVDAPMLIASTTKIMTALVVLNNCDPDEQFQIPKECAGIEGSSMYLKPGETYSVRDLLYGMLLVSGNDAAAALAVHCAGSIESFADMMNETLVTLGLTNSCFKNPHGLDAQGQYSSAYDLAMITRSAMQNELFEKIVSTKVYTMGEHSYMNHNKLLWNYDGCIGVKTGYTNAAGRALVSCAERDGMRLICVTLSDANDWKDHMALYDWAFSEFEYKSVLPMGEICRIPVISGEAMSVGVVAGADASLMIRRGTKLEFSLEAPRFVYAGIHAGETAGSIRVTANGEELGRFPLLYSESVKVADGVQLTPWQRFLRTWFLSNKYGFVLGGAENNK